MININKILKNYAYTAFYNILILIMPLITSPYISRIMGAERIGIYSFSYSIAGYFALFISLGLANYGNRTIASNRESKEQLSKTFWSIYAMQFFMSLIVLSAYIIYIIYFADEKIMASIQFIYLLSVCFDISWFYFGIEQFKLTVTRNTIIKLLNLALIFLLVKTKDDLYIYGITMVIGPLLSQGILWIFLKNYISFAKITVNDVVKHIKPNLVLFIPVIAISLYTSMSKVILGILSSMEQVGYYENSSKITQIPSVAITSFGTVMLPRMSNLISQGKYEEANKYIDNSLLLSAFLSCAMAFGIIAVSNEFIPIFFGSGFEDCINITSVLVISSIFISWANVIRTQYLIPNKKDKIYVVSVFLGAAINIATNIILIPFHGALGAAVATVLTEFVVCLVQTIFVAKELKISKTLLRSLPFVFIGLLMVFILNFISFNSIYITLFAKILLGVIVYLSISFIYYKLKLKKFLSA